jgi:hypothetical protein
MAASWIVTLVRSSWLDILTAMDFPPFEMEILQRVPLQGFHFSVLAGVPLLLTLAAIIRARRCFGTEGRVWPDETREDDALRENIPLTSA